MNFSCNGTKAPTGLAVHRAGSGAELRAAAYLRAIALFGSRNNHRTQRVWGNNQEHGRGDVGVVWDAHYTHIVMLKEDDRDTRDLADRHWEELEDRIAGVDVDYSNILCECYVASIPDKLDSILAHCVKTELVDLSCKLPANGMSPPRLVVGSLDLNIGPWLPREPLVGKMPRSQAFTRAYLSNVCVMPSARRQGVATEMVRVAGTGALEQGAEYLYAHVESDNQGALDFYNLACGFKLESKETYEQSFAFNHKQRVLLRKKL